MLNGLREEQPAGVARDRLFKHPQEEVLVQQIEQHESHNEQTIDDRCDDGVCESFTVISDKKRKEGKQKRGRTDDN